MGWARLGFLDRNINFTAAPFPFLSSLSLEPYRTFPWHSLVLLDYGHKAWPLLAYDFLLSA